MKYRDAVLIAFPLVFSFCTKPYEKIEHTTWEGQIHRIDDDKVLSDVRLKLSDDTLYIFSNAIFGADNDTLLLQNFTKTDSVFTYKSINGRTFNFKYKYERDEDYEYVYFIGNDYYITLTGSIVDLRFEGALDFYKNIKVPRESFMYLDGAYEGQLEMENQLSNMFLAEMGGITIKLVFINDFKVNVYFKNAFVDFFSGSTKPNYETVNYNVVGNKLYLNKNKSKAEVIEVKNGGETLVLATDEANIILHKIY